MNVISLSRKQFDKLNLLSVPHGVINTEGEIYDFVYKREDKIIKNLYYQDGVIFANKLYTLEMLDYYREMLPDMFMVPDSLVTVSHRVVGFSIPKIKGINLSMLLKNSHGDLKTQILYLKKIGELLQEMKYIRKYTSLKDLFLNDLHEDNFIIEDTSNELKVVDLDSCKISDNFVFPARYLTPFSLLNYSKGKYTISNDDRLGYVVPDENTDLYCYNIIILNYLRGEKVNNYSISEFYDFINYLDMIEVDKNLLDSFNSLLSNSSNINPYLYLDTINYKKLSKARLKNLK